MGGKWRADNEVMQHGLYIKVSVCLYSVICGGTIIV